MPMLLPRLREVRERLAISQRELARRAKTCEQTVVRLERGQQAAYPSTTQRLAKALQVRPGRLMAPEHQMEVTR